MLPIRLYTQTKAVPAVNSDRWNSLFYSFRFFIQTGSASSRACLVYQPARRRFDIFRQFCSIS